MDQPKSIARLVSEEEYQERKSDPYWRLMEAEGCLDLSHNVYYDEESWQRELELPVVRRGRAVMHRIETMFSDLCERLKERGYAVWSRRGDYLLLVKEENEKVCVAEVVYPASGEEIPSACDIIRVRCKDFEKEETWYISVKTGVTVSLQGNKMYFSEEELRFAKRQGNHYCIAVLLLDGSNERLPFCRYETDLEPAFLETEKGELISMTIRSRNTRFEDTPVGLSNLFYDGDFFETRRLCFVSCLYEEPNTEEK